MSRRAWAWVRLGGGFAVLTVLVWRLGSGAFLQGLRTVDARALAIASLIAFRTTVCCAWRWSVIVRGLGSGLPLPTAIAAYYRSQFLNSTLPAGVLGDVHRAVRQGRACGDVSRGARAVVYERLCGQLVQVTLTVVVLLALPSPVHSSLPAIVALAAVGSIALALAVRSHVRGSSSWAGRLRATGADLRAGLLARRAWPVVVLASVLAVVGHLLTFLVAARTVGFTGSVAELLPLALMVLVAMAIPANVAGWGPREGVAAWVFGAAGLGAAQGVAIAVVYGVLVFVASLPGAAFLLTGIRGAARA